ncbi:MAG: hypothetical protein RIE73_23750 [Coleofasciculus sp. C1-SOL-03]|uniref:cyclic-phosphate processing receiver domain-containing protein n=1 Tax=Coleofasciculus sp. C1-SOL-03 TaxID=3069522 RepID=UPI0033001C03
MSQNKKLFPLRVLLIEDTEERQNILTSLYRDHAWILVKTGNRAIKLLNAYDFDMISIDYNIGGELNGANVVLFIRDSRHKNSRIIVHSLNPKGAKYILEILPKAIYYPVSKMVRSNQKFKYIRQKNNELGVSYEWG